MFLQEVIDKIQSDPRVSLVYVPKDKDRSWRGQHERRTGCHRDTITNNLAATSTIRIVETTGENMYTYLHEYGHHLTLYNTLHYKGLSKRDCEMLAHGAVVVLNKEWGTHIFDSDLDERLLNIMQYHEDISPPPKPIPMYRPLTLLERIRAAANILFGVEQMP